MPHGWQPLWRRLVAVTLLLLPMTTPAVQQNSQSGQSTTAQTGAQGSRNAGVRPKRTQERKGSDGRAASSAKEKTDGPLVIKLGRPVI